jgi:transcriptional regulator with XRE-family HTH domain
MAATEPDRAHRWTVGDEIRSARVRAHMDQAELARAVGVARPTISKWERGVSEPTLSQARAIARATGDPYLLSPESGWICELPDPRLERAERQLALAM